MATMTTLPLYSDLLEQLNLAHELQQSLLPNPNISLPYASACSKNIPCHEVGGDYFDYFDLDGGRFCFALGDVAGKGVPAALTASVVQGILSAQMSLGIPIPEIISNLNLNLVRSRLYNKFVTFFFGMLDSEGGCSYVNAGHNPPILLGRNGSLRELTEGGTILGAFAESHYDCHTLKMRPGEHLVLFTDGVIETRNAYGEEFGNERLCTLLRANAHASAQELLICLQDSIQCFSANTPQYDDITMMILGFRESRKRHVVQ